MGKCFKLVKIIQKTEELHGNGGSNEEEAHSEENEAAQLLAWTKYLVHKVFQDGGGLDESHDAKNLKQRKNG